MIAAHRRDDWRMIVLSTLNEIIEELRASAAPREPLP